MNEILNKKEVIKKVIKMLHESANPEEVKERFKEVIKNTTPTEIAQIEEELIKEGMQREEVQRLCNVHLAVFKESLESDSTLAPAGHPINILMEEHKILLGFADKLRKISVQINEVKDLDQLKHLAEHFKESESHYVREENVLFPFLEKHGITQPPAIMWMEHDKIREIKKRLYLLIEKNENMASQDFARQLEEIAISLTEMLTSHFYKENNILFPTALKVINEDEWKDIRQQFDELGYCCFTPQVSKVATEVSETPIIERNVEGNVPLETGTLSKDEIEAILDNLPVDITFVDKRDTVRYFNQSKDRIFPRTKAVIGREVQQCHPQKSLHIVNQILKDFKSGKRDVAEFWIQLNGKFIHIRYFAMRKNGEYLGCLEVTQDITKIKKIEGEKRLL